MVKGLVVKWEALQGGEVGAGGGTRGGKRVGLAELSCLVSATGP